MTEISPKLDGIRPLGAGLGYRDPYRTDLFLHRESSNFLEIIADHFMGVAFQRAEQQRLLARLATDPALRASLLTLWLLVWSVPAHPKTSVLSPTFYRPNFPSSPALCIPSASAKSANCSR